jgi:hypothetical protein
MVDFISLRDLFLQLFLLFLVIESGLIVFGPILLQFQLFFNVVEIVLIHLGEEIARLLFLMPDQLGGVGFDLVF